tara:strand:+ start:132 stop:797 length:666 start_codon:yes stop_codon:yes gene_type:complete
MSTTYPHYYLFLLPSLSIIFATNLDSFSFRFLLSKKTIQYFLITFMLSIGLVLLALLLYLNQLSLEFPYSKIYLIYIITLFLILSYISSIRFLFDSKMGHFNLINFFYNIIIPQFISISLFYNFGILGNPNFKTKSFINDKAVSKIIKSNTIYLYQVDSKIRTLLSYYLPSSKVITSINDISNYNYVITSDINILDSFYEKPVFKSIKKFDKHFLLMNISK